MYNIYKVEKDLRLKEEELLKTLQETDQNALLKKKRK